MSPCLLNGAAIRASGASVRDAPPGANPLGLDPEKRTSHGAELNSAPVSLETPAK